MSSDRQHLPDVRSAGLLCVKLTLIAGSWCEAIYIVIFVSVDKVWDQF